MIDTYILACMLKNDVSNVGTFKKPNRCPMKKLETSAGLLALRHFSSALFFLCHGGWGWGPGVVDYAAYISLVMELAGCPTVWYAGLKETKCLDSMRRISFIRAFIRSFVRFFVHSFFNYLII